MKIKFPNLSTRHSFDKFINEVVVFKDYSDELDELWWKMEILHAYAFEDEMSNKYSNNYKNTWLNYQKDAEVIVKNFISELELFFNKNKA